MDQRDDAVGSGREPEDAPREAPLCASVVKCAPLIEARIADGHYPLGGFSTPVQSLEHGLQACTSSPTT